MVFNFKTRGISRDTRKLARKLILIKKIYQMGYGRVNYCIIVCGIGYDILMNKLWIVSRTTTPTRKKKKERHRKMTTKAAAKTV